MTTMEVAIRALHLDCSPHAGRIRDLSLRFRGSPLCRPLYYLAMGAAVDTVHPRWRPEVVQSAGFDSPMALDPGVSDLPGAIGNWL